MIFITNTTIYVVTCHICYPVKISTLEKWKKLSIFQLQTTLIERIKGSVEYTNHVLIIFVIRPTSLVMQLHHL